MGGEGEKGCIRNEVQRSGLSTEGPARSVLSVSLSFLICKALLTF